MMVEVHDHQVQGDNVENLINICIHMPGSDELLKERGSIGNGIRGRRFRKKTEDEGEGGRELKGKKM